MPTTKNARWPPNPAGIDSAAVAGQSSVNRPPRRLPPSAKAADDQTCHVLGTAWLAVLRITIPAPFRQRQTDAVLRRHAGKSGGGLAAERRAAVRAGTL